MPPRDIRLHSLPFGSPTLRLVARSEHDQLSRDVAERLSGCVEDYERHPPIRMESERFGKGVSILDLAS